jgi:hypothetical protein|tara:strand:- start:872 stop:1012 length:141 start_codon:yes stop_codon:yes gene_type:complete
MRSGGGDVNRKIITSKESDNFRDIHEIWDEMEENKVVSKKTSTNRS